ncbi:MAG: GntR family transcriptional regulator [Pseudomonadales bacterium]|nr:GntR family transcriptional regulator [Pseudomonadales bacterium]
MITIGNRYELTIVTELDFGFYLDAQNLGEVLLPRKLAQNELQVGDTVDVFLYLDSEDRPVATTQQPKAAVGQFAYLEVIDSTPVGAFLDWGLDKDLLVPFAEQHRPMEVGKSYLVYIYLDRLDGRITASSKIDSFLDDNKPHTFTPQQPVKLIIANTTELGFKVIVNNTHWGLLYQNDVHQRLSFGQRIDGFVKYVRPDGRLDISLQGGKETRDKYTNAILNHLKYNKGYSPLNDKSDPKLIADQLGMSKKAFKKSIGGLYKNRVIRIEADGIHLIENSAKEN